MAIGPKLDLRQSQSLVMTPQLRQAIKLLQFSNMEVAQFVAEELERNPLLEQSEEPTYAPAETEAAPAAAGDAAAAPELDRAFADGVAPDGEAPIEADHYGNSYDAEGPGDGAASPDTPTAGLSATDWGASGSGGRSDFSGDDRTVEELAGADTRTLRDHIEEQLRVDIREPADRLIARHLILMLNPAGWLEGDIGALADRLGATRERVEGVLRRMQEFDPPGVFARGLKECLAIQLRDKNRLDPAMQALLDNLELLARRDMVRLRQVCGVDAEDLADMLAEIKRLNPKPGAKFETAPTVPVIPDVLMRLGSDGSWIVELNPETLPRVLVNTSYFSVVSKRARSKEDKAFLSERLQTANWLVKSLHQRATTILRVSSEIVRQQDAFFHRGVEHLRPLILRDIALAVDMHESTVSRVTSNKYIETPRGILELKYFFTTAIAGTMGESHSAESVRHRIKTMIDAESPDAILSDDQIVATLKSEGIDIARRTVAKYREALRIPSSVQRRREKAMQAG
ncbi:MAG: RNA polymerase factor sigma-54 [Alphaproteobacteria bacterium]|nr:RNA polymerase factor sigma-54 [Alphaproteobacteria bacterium]